MSRSKAVLLFAVVLSLALNTARAQENQWVGEWVGFGANSLYVASATLFITEPIPQSGVLVLKGTVEIGPRGEERPTTTLRLRGEQIGDKASGTLRGEDRRIRFTGGPERFYEITFKSGTFGKLKIILARVVDIKGVWLFSDGNPMTIKKKGKNKYEGTYRGTAASGHPDLVGVLTGTLRERGNSVDWDGTFTITEGAVVVTGFFVLEYKPPSAGKPAALDGEFSSGTTGTANRITLVKASG